MNPYVKPPLQAVTRNGGIDALRASLVLLVVFHHAAITYGAVDLWFYREIEPSSAPSSFLLMLFCSYNQAFSMGLFFLIAGSLTPGAIARHGAQEFLRERLLRLGAPLLVFILVLGPVTAALAETVHGYPFFAVLGWIASHAMIIPGPMWFVEALLIFSAAYVALRAAIGPARLERARPFPSNAILAVSALGTGAAAFLLRLRWPPGADFLGLQFGYFASYVVLFAAGWPRGQGALARKRADEAALDLAMGLAGRRRGVSCRDPRWPLELRLLCLLGASVRLGRHSEPARFLPAPLRRPGSGLAKVGAAGLSHLHHPPADPGRRVAGDARPRGAGAVQIRPRGDGGLRPLLHRRRSAAGDPRRPARRLARCSSRRELRLSRGKAPRADRRRRILGVHEVAADRRPARRCQRWLVHPREDELTRRLARSSRNTRLASVSVPNGLSEVASPPHHDLARRTRSPLCCLLAGLSGWRRCSRRRERSMRHLAVTGMSPLG